MFMHPVVRLWRQYVCLAPCLSGYFWWISKMEFRWFQSSLLRAKFGTYSNNNNFNVFVVVFVTKVSSSVCRTANTDSRHFWVCAIALTLRAHAFWSLMFIQWCAAVIVIDRNAMIKPTETIASQIMSDRHIFQWIKKLICKLNLSFLAVFYKDPYGISK